MKKRNFTMVICILCSALLLMLFSCANQFDSDEGGANNSAVSFDIPRIVPMGIQNPANPNQDEIQQLINFTQQYDNLVQLGWNLNDFSTWEGILWTEGVENRVQSIDIANKFLSGELDLSGFAALEYLDIAGNFIYGYVADSDTAGVYVRGLVHGGNGRHSAYRYFDCAGREHHILGKMDHGSASNDSRASTAHGVRRTDGEQYNCQCDDCAKRLDYAVQDKSWGNRRMGSMAEQQHFHGVGCRNGLSGAGEVYGEQHSYSLTLRRESRERQHTHGSTTTDLEYQSNGDNFRRCYRRL